MTWMTEKKIEELRADARYDFGRDVVRALGIDVSVLRRLSLEGGDLHVDYYSTGALLCDFVTRTLAAKDRLSEAARQKAQAEMDERTVSGATSLVASDNPPRASERPNFIVTVGLGDYL